MSLASARNLHIMMRLISSENFPRQVAERDLLGDVDARKGENKNETKVDGKKSLSGDDCSVDLLLSSDSFSTAEGCMDVGARCKEKAIKFYD